MLHRRVWQTLLMALLSCLLLSTPAGAETITIGAEDRWLPYSGVIDGKPTGYTHDLVRAAFAAVKVDVKFESLPYARCMMLTKMGKLLACFNTTRSVMVEADYLWSKRPMFQSAIRIYARADHQERNLQVADLEGKQVIVTHAYEYGDAFDMNKKILHDDTPDDRSGFRKLAAGRAPYALAFERVFAMLSKDYPNEFKDKFVAVGLVTTADLYTVFSKTFPDSRHYLALFEQGFDIIRSNGQLAEIERRWK